MKSIKYLILSTVLMSTICFASAIVFASCATTVVDESSSTDKKDTNYIYSFHITDSDTNYESGNTAISSAIDSININWIAGQIILKPTSSSEIIFSEGKSKIPLGYAVDGNTLNINYVNSDNYFIKSAYGKKLVLELPEDIIFSNIRITGSSTTVVVDDINTDNLYLKTSSGTISLRNTKVYKDADISSTSGSVNITHCKIRNSKVSSVSGTVKLDVVSIFSMDTKSTSGSIRAKSLYSKEYFSAESVSGGIDVRMKVPSDSKLKSTSGGIKLEIPEDTGFTAHFSNIKKYRPSDFKANYSNNDTIEYGNGKLKFDISTISGGIKINKL